MCAKGGLTAGQSAGIGFGLDAFGALAGFGQQRRDVARQNRAIARQNQLAINNYNTKNRNAELAWRNDKQNGDIEVDNQSIYKVNLYSLRKNISLVSQETTLFDDTIKNNISYAKLDATDLEISSAAKDSFADDFIQKLPEKYETIIGENGVRLSGGEKQRLSIARAMLKKSPIILLDEATSSLDSDTETKIQNAVKLLTKNKTTVVIAHRLSTILNAHKIYVVDSGKILENGTHEELLVKSNIYKNFYDKQLKEN